MKPPSLKEDFENRVVSSCEGIIKLILSKGSGTAK